MDVGRKTVGGNFQKLCRATGILSVGMARNILPIG
jgi:hypothetical protein